MFVVKEPGDRQMNAVCRCPWHIVDTRFRLENAQGNIERERVARAAAIAVGRHYGHRYIGERGEGVAQAADAFCAEAVIVTDQDLHGWVIGALEGKDRRKVPMG